MSSVPHDRLFVYQRALRGGELAEKVAQSIPGRRWDLRDELQRASSSVILNLAEGAAEFSPAEKVRFYRMSRRSAGECLGVLDMLTVSGIEAADVGAARQEFAHVMALLTRLILSVERRRKNP